jgi:hypothetical protein
MAAVGHGVIRVRRTEAGRDSRSVYRIIVDDQPMGSVRRGDSIDIEVSAGEHQVVAFAGDEYESEPMLVTVRAGETVPLRCMPSVTTVTTMIGFMWGKQPSSGIRLASDDDR